MSLNTISILVSIISHTIVSHTIYCTHLCTLLIGEIIWEIIWMIQIIEDKFTMEKLNEIVGSFENTVICYPSGSDKTTAKEFIISYTKARSRRCII